jgi:hypothetical protein
MVKLIEGDEQAELGRLQVISWDFEGSAGGSRSGVGVVETSGSMKLKLDSLLDDSLNDIGSTEICFSFCILSFLTNFLDSSIAMNFNSWKCSAVLIQKSRSSEISSVSRVPLFEVGRTISEAGTMVFKGTN